MQRRPGPGPRREAWPDLIDRARADRSAFGELYDLYLQRVYAFCLARARDVAEAEDLTARTFDRARHALGSYAGHGTPMSDWLYRLAAEVHAERVRKRRPATEGDAEADGDEGPLLETTGTPEEEALRWKRARYLRDLLATLSEEDRQTLRLRYIEPRSDAGPRAGWDDREAAGARQRALENLRHLIDGATMNNG